MGQIRFGLVGTGYWAVETQGAALASSPVAELHGVWGRDPAKAEAVAGRLGARGYPDLDEMLANVDAVSLAVPPDVQAGVALRAAQAGCHLLMDKPMALDVEAAEALAAAVREADVAAIIFFTARYRPDLERWTQAAAAAGPWHSAHLVHYGNIYGPGSPYASSPWRHQRGALWDIGPHALAAVVPIMGRVSSVAARPGPAGSDTVHLVLSHAGADASAGGEVTSGVSTVSLSLTIPPGGTATSLALYGEPGVRARPEGGFEAVEAFRVAVGELAEMVATGERRHRCDAAFGLQVVRALAAAEQALEQPAVDVGY